MIEKFEFIVLDRRAQFIFCALPHAQLFAHLRLEKGEAVAPGLF
ncbi:MAG: hypothetical protein WDN29_02210 [Methylovirgula sp.]